MLKTNMSDQDLFRLTKSKKIVDISPNTLRAYNKMGLKFYRCGGKAVWVSKSELTAFITQKFPPTIPQAEEKKSHPTGPSLDAIITDILKIYFLNERAVREMEKALDAYMLRRDDLLWLVCGLLCVPCGQAASLWHHTVKTDADIPEFLNWLKRQNYDKKPNP